MDGLGKYAFWPGLRVTPITTNIECVCNDIMIESLTVWGMETGVGFVCEIYL